MKLVIVSFIVAIVMLVTDQGKAEEFSAEQLDKILEEHSYDYRQEIEEDVFKPCLQYYLKRIERRYASIGWDYNEKLIHSELSLLVMKLRKMEPSIYYEAIKHDAEMRNAIYALVLAQCKKQVDESEGG
ncbi:MAG: hypothetical protein F4X63_07370 [Nitrospira sp. SB0662_bin_26]|nr:hypothetical protein [Nitrospira sp. SB0662_bin_26]